MNLLLRNSTALVTTATHGIGLEIVRALAEEGTRVIVNGRTNADVENALQSIRRQIPEACLEKLVANLDTEEGCLRAIRTVPDVDILICVGTIEMGNWFAENDDSWRRVFEANILSCIRLSRHYLGTMLENNAGRLIFVCDESQQTSSAGTGSCQVARGMLLSVTTSLMDFAYGTKVAVHTVLSTPSRALFEAGNFSPEEFSFSAEKRSSEFSPRVVTRGEVAALVAFLSSPRSGAVNGTAIQVRLGPESNGLVTATSHQDQMAE
jgi:3-oxoacyl-[acyl-carrier protein] reductase